MAVIAWGPSSGGHLSVSRARVYRQIMLKRRVQLPPEHLYPADEWRFVEARYSDEFRVPSRRIVSLEHRHLVAMTYEVTMLDEPAPVVVSALVLNRQDASLTGQLPERLPGDPRLATMLPHRVLNMRAASTCSASGPRARSSSRHHDRDAARKSSVSGARAPALPSGALRARRAWS